MKPLYKYFTSIFIILSLSSCWYFFVYWKELATQLCYIYSSCLNDSELYVNDFGTCFCECKEDWCGTRCEDKREDCLGEIVEEKFNGGTFCDCKCFKPYNNPPKCDKRVVHLNPIDGITSILDNQDSYKNLSSGDYFPLNVNSIWLYDILDGQGNFDAEMGLTIAGTTIFYDDLEHFDCYFLPPDTTSGFLADSAYMLGPLLFNSPQDSNQVLRRVNDTTTVNWFQHHYSDGDTLIINGQESYVDSIGKVNTPAGTFNNCVRVADPGGIGYIFAPDIGCIAFLEGPDTTAVLSYVGIRCSIGVEFSVSNSGCAGDNDGSININVTGDATNLTFKWDGPIEIEDPQNPTNLSPGFYHVTVSNENCEAIIDSFPITEPLPIEIELVNSENISCYGDSDGSIDVSISGGSGNIDVMWNEGAYATEDITGLFAGCYILEVMDSLGCTAEITVDLIEPDELVIEIDEKTDVSCFGESNGAVTILVEGGTVDYMFNWNNDTYTTQDISGLVEGTYNLLVTDGNGCTELVEVDIIQPEELSLELMSTEASENMANGTASVIAEGGIPGYSYLWNDESSQTTSTAVNLLPGEYTIIVTDQNGCSETGIVEVGLSTATEDLILGHLDVYPNPLNDRLFVRSNNHYYNKGRYEIINATGKTVIKNRIPIYQANIFEINVDALEKGLYILKIIVDGKSRSIQFLKLE